jgi:ankyrin repeat protein
VEKLIKQGADPNKPRNKTTGITPLYLAAQKGHESTVDKLGINGADINQPIANGTTPLMIAVQTDQVGTAAALLKNHADPDKRNPQTQFTALFDAVMTGNEAMTKLLLDHRAQVDLDVKGVTPLFAAAQTGQTRIAHLLLQKGAKPDALITTKPEVLMDIPNKSASSAKVTDFMIKLCKTHQIAHINTPITNFSALHIAAFLGHDDMVRELLKNGADPQAKAEYGISVRELAINPAIQRLLDQASTHLASNPLVSRQTRS